MATRTANRTNRSKSKVTGRVSARNSSSRTSARGKRAAPVRAIREVSDTVMDKIRSVMPKTSSTRRTSTRRVRRAA